LRTGLHDCINVFSYIFLSRFYLCVFVHICLCIQVISWVPTVGTVLCGFPEYIFGDQLPRIVLHDYIYVFSYIFLSRFYLCVFVHICLCIQVISWVPTVGIVLCGFPEYIFRNQFPRIGLHDYIYVFSYIFLSRFYLCVFVHICLCIQVISWAPTVGTVLCGFPEYIFRNQLPRTVLHDYIYVFSYIFLSRFYLCVFVHICLCIQVISWVPTVGTDLCGFPEYIFGNQLPRTVLHDYIYVFSYIFLSRFYLCVFAHICLCIQVISWVPTVGTDLCGFPEYIFGNQLPRTGLHDHIYVFSYIFLSRFYLCVFVHICLCIQVISWVPTVGTVWCGFPEYIFGNQLPRTGLHDYIYVFSYIFLSCLYLCVFVHICLCIQVIFWAPTVGTDLCGFPEYIFRNQFPRTGLHDYIYVFSYIFLSRLYVCVFVHICLCIQVNLE